MQEHGFSQSGVPNQNAQPEIKGRQYLVGEIWDGDFSEVHVLGRFCCSYLFETWANSLLALDTCNHF